MFFLLSFSFGDNSALVSRNVSSFLFLGLHIYAFLSPPTFAKMNRNFRGLKYFIRSQWKRRIQHDAVSTQLRREPARAKQWDPWKSPFTWTLAIIPPFTFALGTWQVWYNLCCNGALA